MKKTFVHLLSLGVICTFSIGCQTVTPDRKLSDSKPTAAQPLPAWTTHQKETQSDQQFLITTKLIEVSRPAGSADIPPERYERKLTDPQYQMFLREISQKKGADLMTAPSVVTRDGKKAAVEVIREFIYPIEPGDDAKKEVENVGVTSLIVARHIGGSDISIKTFTRVSEFEGYSEVKPGFDLPVFKRRDVENSAHLKSGETILVGGILSESSQDIEEAGPLGIIRSHSTHKFSRELIVAVTATIIDPDGIRPIATR
ncbi:MAG: type II secretory pathway component GspD/PulD (secretin) [Pseudoalteromonas tetraodonis]|jgi:type II secretory pathway component GspD/PulD (secretin)